MFVRIVIVASTALFLAMLAGAGPATAQEIPAEKSVEEMLAYTPTGDALWDRYAQALLTSLPAAELDLSWVGISAPLLPDELLADWEADFADDPRYWQLRSWNATQTDLWLRSNPDFNPLTMFEYMFKGEDEIPRRGEYKGPSSHSFLERAIELGVADALIWMQYHSDWAYTYRDLQRRFESDELTEEERAELPQLENPDDVLAWLVENELAEYGKMIEHCPGDSWPYYQRASRNFHFDRWDDGMADLRAGNQAEHNRLPLFFPMSFLVDALSNEQDCGSEIVAGWIDPYGVEIRLPNSVGIKQSWRKQQELLEPGASLADLSICGIWSDYFCRSLTAYGTNNLDWMILSTTGGIFTRYLQVQVAGSFTAEQLDALWLLNANYRGISKTTSVNYETELVRKECLNERIKPMVLPYVVPPDEDDDDVALRDLISLPPDVEMEVKLLMLEHQYNEAVIEYSDTYNAVLKRCDRIGRFNWETSTFDD